MTVATFGVTAASVRSHHFPQWSAFSAETSPDSTTAGEMVTEAGADLAGVLTAAGVTPSSISDVASAAYSWCAYTVRLDAALRILRASTQASPDLEKTWQARLDARYAALKAAGAAALGDEALAPVDPDGPSSHISELGLEVGNEAEEASSAYPLLRRDDVR